MKEFLPFFLFLYSVFNLLRIILNFRRKSSIFLKNLNYTASLTFTTKCIEKHKENQIINSKLVPAEAGIVNSKWQGLRETPLLVLTQRAPRTQRKQQLIIHH